MLDIRAIRDDPDRFRAGLARRNLAEAVDQLLAARRAPTFPHRPRRRAPRGTEPCVEGHRRGRRRGQAAADRRGGRGLGRAEGSRAPARRRRRGAQRSAGRHPERAARERARRVHRRGRRRDPASPGSHDVRVRTPRPRGAGNAAGRARRRARRPHQRVTLRLPARRPGVRAVRVDAARHGHPGGARASCRRSRRCWFARRRCTEPGFLPADEAQLYTTTEDELYLVGTAEVPLAAFHMGEILDEADLPLRYAGLLHRASGAKPARMARTWVACSGCTSSTRWRCSLHDARGQLGRARASS